MKLRRQQEHIPDAILLSFRCFYFLCCSFLAGALLSRNAIADDNLRGQFMGTGSCSSSNCHGNVAPVNAGHILQNEYVTWQKHDKHANAYKVLGNEQSQIIAKHLGIGSPQNEAQCLKCHSTYVPAAKNRGDKYQVEDGVTCEACHGAAGAWLSSHTTREATHAKNVELGMPDLVPLEHRTKLCLSCHHGNEEKTVDHRLIAAGHPRLTFELDTFESILPRHWEMDQDYRDRKMDYHSTSAWLDAQVSQAHEELAQLSSKKKTDSAFPEFSMFNCYACHHSLADEQYKKRTDSSHTGDPTLNLPALVMLNQAAKVLTPNKAAEFESTLASLQKDFHNSKDGTTIATLRKLVDDKAFDSDVADAQRRKLLKQLINFAASTAYLQYETAEQVAMGISSLVAESDSDSKNLQNEIDGLYKALKIEKSFNAEDFTAAAEKLRDRAAKL